MFYYRVWVRSNRYHSSEYLTYSSPNKLASGSIIKVELQKQVVLAFIVSATPQPKFKTKDIRYVYDLPVLPNTLIKMATWLKEYYPAPLGVVAQQLLPPSLPTSVELNEPDPLPNPTLADLPPLTKEQEVALKTLNGPGTYLLHGRTGSGKTRVYIEQVFKTLKDNRSAIILSPEIGLSAQLSNNFKQLFGKRVVTIHSQQTPKERQQSWIKCLTATEPLIVIGPRSALFSPLGKLGLIVVDEVHDSAYKQEQLPHYQAVRVASALSELSKAQLILGSATPSISDYYLAQAKTRPIITLARPALKTIAKTEIEIVDLKDRGHFNISPILSTGLIDSINKSLENGEQSLIFLNRRGTSRLIFCEQCGWEALCPNCHLPLIYHADLHQLRCHSCGFVDKQVPSVCPSCGSSSILYTTIGTKAVVSEVQKLFKNTVIARFDTDNRKADSLSSLYQSILEGRVNILIGTQQLAKGFDLPKLSTVGILQADTNLYLPDFSSSERSFQLITQVLGRINRGHVAGRAIIQTYHPDSQLLKAAINQDYLNFYNLEISERSKFQFPPFYSLLKLSTRRASPGSAEAAGQKLKDIIKVTEGIIIEGPAPAFHEKHATKFEWQIVVKSTNRRRLLEVIKLLPSGWSYDLDPNNLL